MTKTEARIFTALGDQEMTGLEILQAVNKGFIWWWKLSPGPLYATLLHMEQQGFIQSRWGEATPVRLEGHRVRLYKVKDV